MTAEADTTARQANPAADASSSCHGRRAGGSGLLYVSSSAKKVAVSPNPTLPSATSSVGAARCLQLIMRLCTAVELSCHPPLPHGGDLPRRPAQLPIAHNNGRSGGRRADTAPAAPGAESRRPSSSFGRSPVQWRPHARSRDVSALRDGRVLFMDVRVIPHGDRHRVLHQPAGGGRSSETWRERDRHAAYRRPYSTAPKTGKGQGALVDERGEHECVQPELDVSVWGRGRALRKLRRSKHSSR